MIDQKEFSADVLFIDPEEEVNKISKKLRSLMVDKLKRRGLVLGLSGGIDSSVTAGLCARALGAEKVLALQMPERHSADETILLSRLVSDHFGIKSIHEDISSILESVGYYERYDNAVRLAVPEYGKEWKSKIVIPSIVDKKGFNLFSIVALKPDGTTVKKRLPLKAYLEVVAATNFKQRIRKMLEYYHADRLNFAVAGTPNRLEYDQGFFVKLGD
ncbi:MAG: NAD(+) synthase, partial [Thermodesulfobacteriota bacterium]|nr:NAD(+) synthase [Thermodesulfobacteriota bacterium]